MLFPQFVVLQICGVFSISFSRLSSENLLQIILQSVQIYRYSFKGSPFSSCPHQVFDQHFTLWAKPSPMNCEKWFSQNCSFTTRNARCQILFIALRGWCTEHELYLELVEIFYGEMVFRLNKDNIWKNFLKKLSNKATRWVERLEIVWCEPK